ncbi:hypothetical protein N6H14_28280 [Paenibacillus sp. CC-CFT747]|nr:hypothetical protein N6H14_28280 [Paenibacillus sp. CC-CFT747]
MYNRHPYPLNPRYYGAGENELLSATRTLWWSQRGIINMGYLFRDQTQQGAKLPVTVAVWEGGIHSLSTHEEWIVKTCQSGRTVLVANLTGVGPLLPYRNQPQDDPHHPFGVLDKHTDELMLLHDSMAALRTYDVLRAVELAAGLDGADGEDLHLYGSGRYALYTGLAALLEPKVRKVRMEDHLESLEEWAGRREYDMTDSLSFLLPGMLRYFDLPEMDGWLRNEGRLDY